MFQGIIKDILPKEAELFLIQNTLARYVNGKIILGICNAFFLKKGKRNHVRVHRIIAITLLKNPYKLPQVNHKDGNKLNNDITNLEWVDNKTNTKHGYDNNLYHSHRRSHEIDVFDKKGILVERFPSIRKTAQELCLNRKTITSILKNEKKNNYPYIFKYADESVETIESVS